MQTCIWPSGCLCHSLSRASVKSRLVLPFWYRLTSIVPEKGPLNVCVCVRVRVRVHVRVLVRVCVCVGHNYEPTKRLNDVLGEAPHPAWEGAILGGHTRA